MKKSFALVCLTGFAGIFAHSACSTSESPPELEVSHETTRSGARGEVLTSKNDNARTGSNLEEDVLEPQSVRSLVLAARLPVDGELYAQPLVVSGVQTGAGAKNLVLAATTNSTVYAFDLEAADGAPPIWQTGRSRELGSPGITSRNVDGPNGILSTPVVDKAAGLLYVVARACDPNDQVDVGGRCGSALRVSRCSATLFALDLATGAIRNARAIAGSFDNGSTTIAFDATVHWNRPGLLLEQGAIYVAFGSGPNGNQHEEDFDYHGWLFRYETADLTRSPAIYVTTPRGRGGSIWQSGAGPASDGAGVFFTASNPILDCTTPPSGFPASPRDAEDSAIRLPVDDVSMHPANAKIYADTRPYTAAGYSGTVFQFTASGDVGFGSGGPTLIPDSRDLVIGTKGGIVYLLDRDTMLPRQAPIVPFTALPFQGDHTLYIHSWHDIPVIPGAFVLFRPERAGALESSSYLFAWAADDYLRSFRYDHAARTLVLDRTAAVPPMPRGAFLSLSARGHARGSAVVWANSRSLVDRSKGHIWAFDAESLERLWDAETSAFSKFTPPTIARGKLIVPSALTAGAHEMLVFGVPK